MGERPKYVNQLEELIEFYLEKLKEGNLEPGERSKVVTELNVLIERLQARETSEMEFYDKTKRREMEEKKNEESLRIEKKKLHMPVERILLALCEIGLPLTFAAALIPYMAKFESEGRVCSSIAREVWNLPKIFMKKYH